MGPISELWSETFLKTSFNSDWSAQFPLDSRNFGWGGNKNRGFFSKKLVFATPQWTIVDFGIFHDPIRLKLGELNNLNHNFCLNAQPSKLTKFTKNDYTLNFETVRKKTSPCNESTWICFVHPIPIKFSQLFDRTRILMWFHFVFVCVTIDGDMGFWFLKKCMSLFLPKNWATCFFIN